MPESESITRLDPKIVSFTRLDALRIDEIPMTVPEQNGLILVGGDRDKVGATTLLCVVNEPLYDLTIRRRDNLPIASYTDSVNVPIGERLMLKEPVDHLDLFGDEDGWFADIDPRLIHNTQRFMGFIGVVATFAYKKQREMRGAVPIRRGA